MMNRLKIALNYLHQFRAYFFEKNCAADVAADLPLTCRWRAADIAADAAADVRLPERPESVFPTPIHIIVASLQNIAPQKRSWRFL